LVGSFTQRIIASFEFKRQTPHLACLTAMQRSKAPPDQALARFGVDLSTGSSTFSVHNCRKNVCHRDEKALAVRVPALAIHSG
jgi:hypothetical protein